LVTPVIAGYQWLGYFYRHFLDFDQQCRWNSVGRGWHGKRGLPDWRTRPPTV